MGEANKTRRNQRVLRTFSQFKIGFKSKMSAKAQPPELKKFMDKRVHLKVNGNRAVEGILRGFDPFMNLVLDETIEFTKSGERNAIGMTVIRGNSVVMLDAKERV